MRLQWIELLGAGTALWGRLLIESGAQRCVLGAYPSSILVEASVEEWSRRLLGPCPKRIGPLTLPLLGEGSEAVLRSSKAGTTLSYQGSQIKLQLQEGPLLALRMACERIPMSNLVIARLNVVIASCTLPKERDT
jgi:hypothetical protein